ncbi:MAG: pyridoxal phosphate-dependent decarboxylase family protein [Anaerolineales bacterium]
MHNVDALLHNAAERGVKYLREIDGRRAFPAQEDIDRLQELDFDLPESGRPPEHILKLLDEIGSPATVATAGPRYFGFVIGGSLPAALAANWLAGAWDQNAFSPLSSTVGAKLEEISLGWLREVFGFPETADGALVTGATMANYCGVMAARHALLAKKGWDVEARGLYGAPEINVLVGEEVHSSLIKALGMAGLGRERVTRVPVDAQGRMRADALLKLIDLTLLCIQAGNVNSGAFDPAEELCAAARAAGAWVHVDGAFGLWATASPKFAHLAKGADQADSWACDAHKWLNVPYDCGFVFVREPQHLGDTFSQRAAYLKRIQPHEPYDYTPESSRRARGIEVWASLLSLGRQGLAEMIERNCAQAQRIAEGLRKANIEVLNDVVLNQVVVTFGDETRTNRVIAALQKDGTFWAGGTTWRGRAAMRISFSSWKTNDSDVDRSLEAILRVNAEEA